MRSIGFLVDTSLCIGCQSCRVGCQVTNATGADTNWRTVSRHLEGVFPVLEQLDVSLACNHCADPACMQICPIDAISKRDEDGIVIIDTDYCNGCMRCVSACPYGAPRANPEKQEVSKCHFCYDRQDQGLPPACVETCVGGALQFGPLDSFEERAGGRTLLRQVEGFFDPAYTNPSTRFLTRD